MKSINSVLLSCTEEMLQLYYCGIQMSKMFLSQKEEFIKVVAKEKYLTMI